MIFRAQPERTALEQILHVFMELVMWPIRLTLWFIFTVLKVLFTHD